MNSAAPSTSWQSSIKRTPAATVVLLDSEGLCLEREADFEVEEVEATDGSAAKMGEILLAEEALRDLWLMAQHAELSEVGVTAFFERLAFIHRFVRRQRRRRGMPKSHGTGLTVHQEPS